MTRRDEEIQDTANDIEFETAIAEGRELDVEDQELAERSLRAIAHWRSEEDRIRSHAQTMRNKADEWERHQLKYVNDRERFHANGLEAFLNRLDRKSLRLINGTIRFRKMPEKVVIEDVDAFLLANEDRVGGTILIRTEMKRSPDKRMILDMVKRTGEIPPGCDIVRDDDKFLVEVS